MKHIKKLVPILLISLFFYACSDDDDNVEEIKTNTVVDVAINSNFTSLVAAVVRAELVETLSGPGPFTVLAPTNEAFAEFLAENEFTTVNDVPKPLLQQILLNHVIDGKLMSSDLSTSYANTKANSDASGTPMSIYINIESPGNVKFNGVSSVTTPNIDADNGVVHVVDKVIALPSVVTFATADPNFSILVQAITREASFTYVSTLSTGFGTTPAPFTVFAPTNLAFQDLLAELEVDGLADIDTPTLTSTLNTHVIPNANVQASGLSDGMTIDNTLGGNLMVDLTGSNPTLTDSKDRVSTIVATDVQANNGVIHAINKVVLE